MTWDRAVGVYRWLIAVARRHPPCPDWHPKNNDGGHARLINWSRPVLGSRREPSTDRIPFLVPATKHQRIASCWCFPPQTINGSRPVLRSRQEPSTGRVQFLVPVTNHQLAPPPVSAALRSKS